MACSNFDTATATVVVLNPIDAVVDTFPTQTPSTTVATTVGSVLSNNGSGADTLNGVAATTTNTDVTPITTGPLSIDANGVLTLAPNTTSGTYSITYQLCESGTTVACSNFDTATATVVVLNPIDAVVDTFPTQTPSTTVATTVGSVLSNNGSGADTLNGVAATTTNTDVTPITTGPLSIDANGVLTLAPNTTSGTYSITYQLCESGTTVACSNFDTATATVVVLNPIDAVVDTFPTQTPSTTVATTVGSVLSNNGSGADTLNGVAATTTNTDVTPITTGPLSIDANGVLTLAPNTTSGTYSITYQLCESGTTVACSNFDTATATVVVLNPIDAVVDTFPTQTPSTTVATTVGSVLSNNGSGADTLNGVAATITNTDVTPITTGPLSIDANGVLTLAPNTTSGTYSITYQLCESGTTVACSNFDTATATVVVLNPIDAVVDTFPTQTPSTTVATTVGSVLSNNGSGADTLNGVAATTTNTDVTPITTGPLSIDANGVLTLAPNTTSGTYSITYQLCESGTTVACSNFDTATATVVVLNPIDAKDDTNPIAVNGFMGGIAIPTVLSNDTLNSVLVQQSQVSMVLTSLLPVGITFNLVTGSVGVNAQTSAGTYTFTYNLCEVGAVPSNCDPATVKVTVSAPIIEAKPDTIAGGDGANGNTNAGNVLNNNGNGTDTLNGVNVTIDQVNLTVTTPATSIGGGPVPVVNTTTGQISVPVGTPAGVYTIVYQICEKLNPTNCSSSTITITILASGIDAVNDDYSATPIPSFPGGTTASVIVNDKLNTLPAIIGTNSGQVKLTAVAVPVGLTLNAEGTIKVASNTSPGTYVVTYSICEVLNPSNCDTATATIVVTTQSPSIALGKTATAVDENGDGRANAGETIRYNFTITNTGNVPLTNITITDLLPGLVLTGGPISLVAGQQDTSSFVGIYKITQTDANNELVTNQATVFGTSPLGTVVKDLSDNYSTTSDGATVLAVKNCVVVVSNALTPNGDGRNEYFHIEGLDCFSNNTVEIYNRWGVLVFETTKYNNVDNVFEGFSKGRTTIRQSEALPDGTYYYVLKYLDFNGNGVQKAGYLYLTR
ncbi:MAG: gliding motility-associated C-terminal domain-containing protein [Flavobacterium sp.]|nr:gliding motility-associated C-terminal domain-containing protein [Flavobacterium sp.]